MKNLPDDIKYAVETLKGGKGSGNWGHGGLAGVHGGSSPTKGGGVVSLSENFDNFTQHITKTIGFSYTEATSDDVRSFMKDEIAHTLSWGAKNGLTYGEINDVMQNWAETSNKTYDAYLMQRAVSEEMGVPLSDWQKKRFAFYEFAEKERYDLVEDFSRRLLDELPKEVDITGDDYPSHSTIFNIIDRWRWDKQRELKERGIEVAIDVDYLAFSGKFTVRFENMNHFVYQAGGAFGGQFQEEVPFNSPHSKKDYGESIKNLRAWITDDDINGDGLQERRNSEARKLERNRKIAKAIYENTQKTIKEVFPKATHLILYRGITDFDFDSKKYQPNAMEAWSLDPRTALDFGGATYPYTLLRATVPIKNIFSTCLSGMGCLMEYEVVILSGNYKISTEKHERFSGLENMLPEDIF